MLDANIEQFIRTGKSDLKYAAFPNWAYYSPHYVLRYENNYCTNGRYDRFPQTVVSTLKLPHMGGVTVIQRPLAAMMLLFNETMNLRRDLFSFAAPNATRSHWRRRRENLIYWMEMHDLPKWLPDDEPRVICAARLGRFTKRYILWNDHGWLEFSTLEEAVLERMKREGDHRICDTSKFTTPEFHITRIMPSE
jgi:hypothetical protein